MTKQYEGFMLAFTCRIGHVLDRFPFRGFPNQQYLDVRALKHTDLFGRTRRTRQKGNRCNFHLGVAYETHDSDSELLLELRR